MKKMILLVLGAFACISIVHAQKMLLLEKTNRVKPKKFYIGDELTYRLHDDYDTWYTASLDDIYPNENSVLLGIQKVKISEIKSLRVRKLRLLKALGYNLAVFGGTWMGYAAVGQVFYGDDIKKRDLVISGTFIGSGLLLARAKVYKKMKMGDKWRLRTIEVKFVK